MQSKPVYRVAAAGLDPRDVRLIEIVFRHIEYNKYQFRLVDAPAPGQTDILIVNSADPDGLEAMTELRAAHAMVPVISALPKGAKATSEHAISIDRLTLQLMPILNRVVQEVIEAGSDEAHCGSEDASAPSGSAGKTAERIEPRLPASPQQPPGHRLAATETGAARRPGPAEPAGAPKRALPLGGTVFELPGETATGRSAAHSARMAGSTPASVYDTRGGSLYPHGAPAPADLAEGAPAMPQQRATSEGKSAGPNSATLVNFPRRNDPMGGHKLRALVVDDSPTVRQQMLAALTRMGMACEIASSGPEAMARLAEGHFDITLVDVVMPDMDGYRLTREIKRNKHLRDMPVIILTSRGSPFDHARGALAGCDAYLKKPVPLRQLEAALAKTLRRALAIDDIGSLLRLSNNGETSRGGRGRVRIYE